MRINEEKIIDGKRFICVEFDKDGSPVLQRTKLYICDHAKRSCSCHGELYKPHSHNRIYDGMCPGYKVMVKGIPYKEEPKTKRVAVIWFGEVPVDKCENPVICDEMTGYLYDQVELIDCNRVSIETRGSGAKVYHVDPPPEPETVEEVMRDMPDPNAYTFNAPDPGNFRSYHERMSLVWGRLKAAQEREAKNEKQS